MLALTNITNDPHQILTLIGLPGIQITMTLDYNPRTTQWILGVNDGTTQIQGLAVTTAPNMLRQWKNIISYGITCFRADGLDPYQISDFADQVATLFLLDAADIVQVEAEFFA